MGRAFEFRKARKFKRWGNMARVFTKLGKEITIAAKQGGPEPENNPRLRVLMQTAKKENMPKDNVERAIKRAVSKDFTDYKEMNYEGYGPFGIAIFVETATDNTTRTVANVRSYFNKNGGSLGTSGSLEFLFEHKCVFHIAKKDGMSLEDLELELIDYGVDEVDEDEDEVVLYGEFAQNSAIQKYLGITLLPQAGVALGMSVTVAAQMGQEGAVIRDIILFSVLVYELVGPIFTKIALTKAGEIQPKPAERDMARVHAR